MRFFARDAEILRICRNRSVLHLGCVGFVDAPDPATRLKEARNSLHAKLSEISRVSGLDNSSYAVDYFVKEGIFTNIQYADAERLEDLRLAQEFDVVLAGDIIEHLSNPGLMLNGLKRFMRSDSILVVTTPNAFGLNAFLKYVFGRFREGTEHVASYNPQNLSNLLDRHGYEVLSIDTCYQAHAENNGGLGFIIGKGVLRLLPRVGGTLFISAGLKSS